MALTDRFKLGNTNLYLKNMTLCSMGPAELSMSWDICATHMIEVEDMCF
jgi:hypothetical protein